MVCQKYVTSDGITPAGEKPAMALDQSRSGLSTFIPEKSLKCVSAE